MFIRLHAPQFSIFNFRSPILNGQPRQRSAPQRSGADCAMSATLSLTAETPHGAQAFEARIDRLVIAGWTGRDRAAVLAHIRELELLGVRPPRTTPIFYRAAATLLTTQSA